MNYTTTIDNVAAQKWELNISQAYLFDWIFKLHSWAEKLNIGNDVCYYASRKKACEELPLLSEKPDTIYRLYKQLEAKGVITLRKIDTKDYISLTDKASIWGRKDSSEKNPTLGKKSDSAEKNPSELGNFSENNSEIFPTDNIISINKDNKKIISHSGDFLANQPKNNMIPKYPLKAMLQVWQQEFPAYPVNERDDLPALNDICRFLTKKEATNVEQAVLVEETRKFAKKVKSNNFYALKSLKTVANGIQNIISQANAANEANKPVKIVLHNGQQAGYSESRGVKIRL